LKIIRSIPTVWDETRVLEPSNIGEVAILARRKGGVWFLGVINGPNCAELDDFKLSFLSSKKKYQSLLLSSPVKDNIKEKIKVTKNSSSIDIKLSPADGFVAMFKPMKEI